MKQGQNIQKNYVKLMMQIFAFFCFLLSVFSFLPQESLAAPVTVSKSLSRPALSLGLVGWWTLDGGEMTPNIRDRSTQSVHFNLFGQSPTTTTPGKLGQALSFDGTDDYLEYNGRVDSSTTGTISAWINVNAQTTGEVNTILSYGGGDVATAGLFSFRLEDVAGAEQLKAVQRSDSEATPNIIAAVAPGIRGTGWHHVALVSSGTAWSMYVNGVLMGLTVISGSNNGNWLGDTTVSAGLTRIGGTRYDGTNIHFMDGKIDDSRLFNRALTASEIASLYRVGVAGSMNKKTKALSPAMADGLKGWWTFDAEDINWTTGIVTDRSGSGFSGRLASIATSSTAAGRHGQALYFNGTASHVDVDGAVDPSSYFFTLSYWLRSDGATESYLGNMRWNGTSGWVMDITSGVFYWANGTTKQTWSTGVKPEGAWSMMTVTMNATTLSIYKNGTLIATTTKSVSGGIGAGAYTMKIGKDASSAAYYWKGAIDDVRVYERELSASEIASLYTDASVTKIATSKVGGDRFREGLVGWWTLDSTDVDWNSGRVTDRGSAGNHGYVKNLSTTTSPASGAMGQSLFFHGLNGKIVVGDPADGSLDFGTNSFSYGLWVFSTSSVTAYDMPIWKGGSSAALPGYDLELGTGGWNADLADGTFAETVLFGTEASFLNRWVHLFIVVDRAAGYAYAYADGVHKNGTADNISAFGSMSGASSFTIGNIGTSDAYPFRGMIDDVRIYNRALTPTEVYDLYMFTH